MSKKVLATLGLSFVLVLMVFFGYRYQTQKKAKLAREEIVEMQKQARTELELLRNQALIRLGLIENLILQNVFEKNEAIELRRKISFIQEADLKSQKDLDQFDQYQNELSNSVALYLSSKSKSEKDLKQKLSDQKKFEVIERELDANRNRYTLKAQTANDRLIKAGSLDLTPMPIPLASVLNAPPSTAVTK